MKRSWYLGLTASDIGRHCILVGDPGRVELFAARLDGARVMNEDRGLRTVTGTFADVPVTVTAFGMGAPIATIVLEELASLGAQAILRAGTAMSTGPDVPLGSFVVGLAGYRGEGTSPSYAPPAYPAVADPSLSAAVSAELARRDLVHHDGIIASFDAFYREMLAHNAGEVDRVTAQLAELRRLGVIAADMETAALLVVGSILRVHVGSLCLVTVDGSTRATLEDGARDAGERQLIDVALAAVASLGHQLQSRV